MTVDTIDVRGATLASAGRAVTVLPVSLLVIVTPLGRATAALGDVLALAGVVFFIPFAILAVGMPVALLVKVLLWIAGGF